MNKTLKIISLAIGIPIIAFGIASFSVMIQGGKSMNEIEKTAGKASNSENMTLTKIVKNSSEIFPPDKIYLLAFKKEMTLEVWIENNDRLEYVKSYPFTAFSGGRGPKLRQGDKQIPEGFYKILWLNPNSSYHLSMKISYPNEFDLEKAELEGRSDPGGDIFIHGDSVTIGCIPIGDKNIEDLFYFAEEVGAERFDVWIFPDDARGDSTFIHCRSCPDWIDELYEPLLDSLQKFERTE